MNHITAILFFSRTAQAEAQAKPLVLGKTSAQKVADLAIQQAKKTALATGLPVFHVSEKQQYGNTFGERFANAFEDIYVQGFENVIAIGNDCLTLTADNILNAEELLATTPSVLGPTFDGGVYLIGFQKKSFSKDVFKSIDWQTEKVFSQLSLLNENIKLLPILSDIDTFQDLKLQLEYINIRLKKAILSIIIEIVNCVQKPISIFVLKVYLSLKSLRAPPTV